MSATAAGIAATRTVISTGSRFLTKLRATGMPIREVRRYADLLKAGEGNDRERLALLEAHRERVLRRLEETAGNLELIEWKINLYRERLERE